MMVYSGWPCKAMWASKAYLKALRRGFSKGPWAVLREQQLRVVAIAEVCWPPVGAHGE